MLLRELLGTDAARTLPDGSAISSVMQDPSQNSTFAWYSLLHSMPGAHLLQMLLPVLPAALPLPVVQQLILCVCIPLCPADSSGCTHNNASLAP